MDLRHLEGPSSLQSGKLQQKSRQAHRVEPVDIAKSVSCAHIFSLKFVFMKRFQSIIKAIINRKPYVYALIWCNSVGQIIFKI
jgi:hypothetical protein